MCLTVRGAVFLDLKRNRYIGLPLSACEALHDLLEPSGEPADLSIRPDIGEQPLARQLLDAGLIEAQCAGISLPDSAHMPVPASSFLQFSTGAANTASHPLRFARAYVWARRAVHRRMVDVIEDLDRLRSPCQSAHSAHQVATLASGFHRLRPYAFTARDQCLLHALALLHYLAACELAATWLIGVQTHPWGAHSWVQWQDMVLDASPEQTLSFTPILIA
jgi:hypothetical protein